MFLRKETVMLQVMMMGATEERGKFKVSWMVGNQR